MKRFIGIDPGKSGSLIVLGNDFSSTMGAISFRTATERDIWYELASLEDGQTVAVLENVSAMPSDGKAAAFKFGQSYGLLRGLLIASGIPFCEVTPAKWLAHFNLRKGKNETKTAWKNRHKARAEELFPGSKITHATADALLLATYCRQKWKELF